MRVKITAKGKTVFNLAFPLFLGIAFVKSFLKKASKKQKASSNAELPSTAKSVKFEADNSVDVETQKSLEEESKEWKKALKELKRTGIEEKKAYENAESEDADDCVDEDRAEESKEESIVEKPKTYKKKDFMQYVDLHGADVNGLVKQTSRILRKFRKTHKHFVLVDVEDDESSVLITL